MGTKAIHNLRRNLVFLTNLQFVQIGIRRISVYKNSRNSNLSFYGLLNLFSITPSSYVSFETIMRATLWSAYLLNEMSTRSRWRSVTMVAILPRNSRLHYVTKWGSLVQSCASEGLQSTVDTGHWRKNSTVASWASAGCCFYGVFYWTWSNPRWITVPIEISNCPIVEHIKGIL